MPTALGVESAGLIEAMEQLGYRPPLMFSLFPAPGPLLGLGEAAEGHLSVSMFEPNEPILEPMGEDVTAIVEEFESPRRRRPDLPYTVFETQAAELLDGVGDPRRGRRGRGQPGARTAICDALHESGADTTFHGHLDVRSGGQQLLAQRPRGSSRSRTATGSWSGPSDRGVRAPGPMTLVNTRPSGATRRSGLSRILTAL